MTSAVEPVIRNGRFAGITGVDLTLDSLSKLIAADNPFGKGQATLVSAAGNVVAGPDLKQLTKPLGGTASTVAKQSIAGGKPARLQANGNLLVAVPIAIGANDTWSLVL